MCDISIYKGPTPYHNLLIALDALPEKKLGSDELVYGNVPCALGAFLTAQEMQQYAMVRFKEGTDPDFTQPFYNLARERLNSNVNLRLQATAFSIYGFNDSIVSSQEERFNKVYAWAKQNADKYDYWMSTLGDDYTVAKLLGYGSGYEN